MLTHRRRLLQEGFSDPPSWIKCLSSAHWDPLLRNLSLYLGCWLTEITPRVVTYTLFGMGLVYLVNKWQSWTKLVHLWRLIMTDNSFLVLITLISYLTGAHYVLNTTLGSLNTLSLHTILWSKNYYPHFIEEETQACRDHKTCPCLQIP